MSEFKVRYKSNNNVVYSCKYHVIWCPKYRRPVLVDQIEYRLKEIIQDIANNHDSEILDLEGLCPITFTCWSRSILSTASTN